MRWNGRGELVCPLRGQSLESRLAAQRSVSQTICARRAGRTRHLRHAGGLDVAQLLRTARVPPLVSVQRIQLRRAGRMEWNWLRSYGVDGRAISVARASHGVVSLGEETRCTAFHSLGVRWLVRAPMR